MSAIDPAAPVVARAEIEVRASPTRVWSVLADVEEWPTWNPAVRGVRLQGDLEAGASFRWAAGPGTISARLTRVDEPHLLAWRDRAMGLRVVHVWRIEELPGGCAVTTEACLTGLPARLLARRLRQGVQQDLDAWVRLLKLEAETRAVEAGETMAAPDAGETTDAGGADKTADAAPVDDAERAGDSDKGATP